MVDLSKKKLVKENFDKIVENLDNISLSIFKLVEQTEKENKKNKIKTKKLEIAK